MVIELKIKHGGILISEADRTAGDKFDIIAAINELGHCPFWDDFFLDLNKRYNESVNKKISLNKNDLINYNVLNNYFEKFSKNGHWNNIHQL